MAKIENKIKRKIVQLYIYVTSGLVYFKGNV